MRTIRWHHARILILALVLLLYGCQGQPSPEAIPTQLVQTPGEPAGSATQSTSGQTGSPPAGETLPSGLAREPAPPKAFETAQELKAAEHPPVDHYRLAVQVMGVSPAQLTPQAAPVEYQVGDREEFFISESLDGSHQPVEASLRYLTENAAWWVSENAQADDRAIEAAARQFEESVMPTNRESFGSWPSPGIDGSPLIHILLVQEEAWGGFYGYFSAMNQYPRAVRPFSNEKELLVLNLGGVALDSPSFAGELAHELQHLIQWNLDPNEDLWLNEALSELAAYYNGTPELNVEAGSGNAELFGQNPQIQLTSRPETTSGNDDPIPYAHYAAERLFTVYLLEQFGKGFIKGLVNNPAPGVESIQQELDKVSGAPRFTDVYASWLLANMLNQPDLMQGQFGYRSVAPPPPAWKVLDLNEAQTISGSLPPYGAGYYKLEAENPVEVSFQGSSVAQLTPVDPPSGQYVWYSNRGEESEFSLTRAFDLTGLQSATLNYKVWYEFEEFFDYAYVEISTDEGNTWTVLETAHGTDADPNNQSLGVGYTGESSEWLSESLDLSPYAGREVWLRFEVINDFTLNRDGLQLDDIEIPELGFFDGAENDSGGWEARGFIRSSNLVPADWIVWLVKATSPVDISWIEVGPEQAAEFTVEGLGSDYTFAALVISPTAPVSTMELDYELIFRTP